jgi:hypothetical protein
MAHGGAETRWYCSVRSGNAADFHQAVIENVLNKMFIFPKGENFD